MGKIVKSFFIILIVIFNLLVLYVLWNTLIYPSIEKIKIEKSERLNENEISEEEKSNLEIVISDHIEAAKRKLEKVESYDDYIQKDISNLAPTDFVNVRDVDKTIIIDPIYLKKELAYLENNEIKYFIAQNYQNTVLRKATAQKLAQANKLATIELGCYIRVYEAYRSVEVQSALRNHFVATAPEDLQDKINIYVAAPGHSNHQKGIAVDVALVDIETGKEIEMPSDYLEFSTLAYAYPDPNITSIEAIENTRKFQDIMIRSGFEVYTGEWWHFNDNETKKIVKFEPIDPDGI
ncbi:MAG: M15 family metallopeptidase [Acidaminobacteraceae bacterium]